MRQFIKKCFIFFLIVLALFSSIALSKNSAATPSSDFMAALSDKHHQVDLIKTPKVILGGGSNLAFGIDSKELERTFGVPVVNMGLHAALGLDFILNDLKYSMKQNDIIFLSIEYFLPAAGSYDLQLNASKYFEPANNFYSKNWKIELERDLEKNRSVFRNIFSMKHYRSENSMNAPKDTIYTRSAFNSNGDVIGHLNAPPRERLNDRVIIPYRYWEGIAKLNEFYEYAKSKNVRVFYLFPDYAASEYERNKKAISTLEQDLKQDLKIEILNTPTSMVFPDSCFFDTVYHLNKLGRKERTDRMIAIIKQNSDALNCIRRIKEK